MEQIVKQIVNKNKNLSNDPSNTFLSLVNIGSSNFAQKTENTKVFIEDDILKNLNKTIQKHLHPTTILLVFDKNSQAFIGEKIINLLSPNFNLSYCNLSLFFSQADAVKPNIETVFEVEKLAKKVDIILGIGSGTINDICKLASYNLEKNYLFFATALSMNGYLSSAASIIFDGKKKSVGAKLPLMLFCDLTVLAKANPRFIKAGIADCLVRSFARADWLLSKAIKNTFYDETPFLLTKEIEDKLVELLLKSPTLSQKAILLTTQFILLSGLGMTLSRGSYPASQSEHMLAHLLEETYPKEFKNLLHGEIIAKCLMITAHIQEKLIPQTSARQEILKDYLGIKKLTKIFDNLKIDYNLNEISQNQLKEAIKATPASRDRFTFLNL
ncbi:MAG: iron-containing alcohol dehydrogenase [Alphaproteobacteria bacterium]|jgi:glycerol-1-phosphate dehydrogenase [NAD(P)+]